MKEPVLKRAFDSSVGLLGLVLSSPLWLVFTLAVYLEDRGSVFTCKGDVARDKGSSE